LADTEHIKEFGMSKHDGMKFMPQGIKKIQTVQKGEFIFAATALDHGHIFPMTQALCDAGGVCKYVYDPDAEKVAAFVKQFPEVQAARDLDEILQDKSVHMVAAAGIPNTRGALGIKVMAHGKDYFVDKCPFTTLRQLEAARIASEKTGRKYMVYYGERLHSESSEYALQLIQANAVGRVIQVIGLGPHRLNKAARPSWFFNREQYGGILCDIGCHQAEQFLAYADAKDAKVLHSKAGNFNNPDTPELEDFGDANLLADNGASNYFRVDWFTPEASPVWGDGRLMILGTKGTIEVRKYHNPPDGQGGEHVYLCNDDENSYYKVAGKVGCPYFGALILDCLNRTENAMTQRHAFLAAQLALEAQAKAVKVTCLT
jgi:predicted dehydrogenase